MAKTDTVFKNNGKFLGTFCWVTQSLKLLSYLYECQQTYFMQLMWAAWWVVD